MRLGVGQTPETKGAQTCRAILQAAITRFGRDGFRATSVADIARDAAVGGTVAYAYFPNKEALFLAAVDEDAGGRDPGGAGHGLDVPDIRRWHDTLIFTLVEAVERSPPGARRLLAGLEPDVTGAGARDPRYRTAKGLYGEAADRQARGTVRPTSNRSPSPTGSSPSCCRLDAVTQTAGKPRSLTRRTSRPVFEAACDGTQRARVDPPGSVSAQSRGRIGCGCPRLALHQKRPGQVTNGAI